jgi:hypothetical protein
LVLALEVEERSDTRGSTALVQWLSAIDPEWLLEDYGDELLVSDDLRFDTDKLRVEVISRISYGSVTLEESRQQANRVKQRLGPYRGLISLTFSRSTKVIPSQNRSL